MFCHFPYGTRKIRKKTIRTHLQWAMNGGTCQLKPSQTFVFAKPGSLVVLFSVPKNLHQKKTTQTTGNLSLLKVKDPNYAKRWQSRGYQDSGDFMISCVLGSKLPWMCLVLGDGHDPNSGLYTIIRIQYWRWDGHSPSPTRLVDLLRLPDQKLQFR